jgi:transcriptional regulator with XRE-family HTH domain
MEQGVREGAGIAGNPYAQRISSLIPPGHIRRVAVLCGMPYTTVRDIVNGKRVPRADTLEKIVRALGLDGHWVLTGQGKAHRKHADS